MGVYERELGKEELQNLVNDFTKREDFEQAIKEIKRTKEINENEYEDVKAFEVINESEEDGTETNELALYIKYDNDVLIELSKLIYREKEDNENRRELYTLDVSSLDFNGDSKILKKIAMEDGNLKTESIVENPSEQSIQIPEYLEVSHKEGSTDLAASPALCLDWTNLTGDCCTFRYNANQNNPLIKYNWCGANCGGGCSNSPSMVNDLDSCCKLHDCCYVRNAGYPDRCSCDDTIINCANRTDNAGSGRVKTAFRLKKLAHASCW